MENMLHSLIFLVLITYSFTDITAAPTTNSLFEEENGVLIYVAAIHRHGDRTPVENYPTDPHINYEYPRGWAELTNPGRYRLHKMGLYFKKRYEILTTDTYDPKKIKIDSSNVDRCLLSALSFCSGYFMLPTAADTWHDNINWTPIPVHTKPNEYDKFVAMTKPCYYYTQLSEEFYETNKEFQAMCKQYQPLYDYVRIHAGLHEQFTCGTEADFLKLLTIHDTLKVQKEQFNLTLPPWADMVYNDTVTSMLGKYFLYQIIDPAISRYKVGPFFEELLADMNYHIQPENERRPNLHMFSAHDGNVITVTRTLKIYNDISPPYAAAVVFELYEESDDYYVKVLYKNETDKEPYVMNMPDCPNPCSFNDFQHLVTPFIPTNWDKECLREVPPPVVANTHSDPFNVISFVSLNTESDVWHPTANGPTVHLSSYDLL